MLLYWLHAKDCNHANAAHTQPRNEVSCWRVLLDDATVDRCGANCHNIQALWRVRVVIR